MTEQEKQNREEVFKLMQENPDLPVVPMVDYEIIGEDYGRWLGAWGSSYIGEYLVVGERICFREDDDPWEVEWLIRERQGEEIFARMNAGEAEEAYAQMPWIKAVIVNIDMPG